MGIFSTPKHDQSSSSLQSVLIATLGGAQVSLTLLEKMTDGVPIPFVRAAAGTAVEVIKIARTIQSNRDECEDLLKRSASLLVVILGSLSGKAESTIPDDLKTRLERLTLSFNEVHKALETIEKRNGKRRALLYHFDNAEKLKGCSAKLDWAMQEFQVMSQVDSCLKDIERHEELREEFRKGLSEVRDAIKEQKNTDVTSSLPSTVMPPSPRIFGREEYINKAIILLLSENSTRIVILGPGGMGKTSVALKIIHDARVVVRYGQNRYWVACEQATSVPLLVELLAKALNLPPSASGDRFKEIITMLESSDVLHVILLDNFETPWDIKGQQSNVGDILARLASIPNVSLMLTMRGNQCPYQESIDWTLPRLPSLTQLDLGPAEEAFLRISPDSAGDAELHTLLQELDCMPLAITLMAKLASGGETVQQLLSQWRTERTRLLDQAGGDRRTSIEVSIKLSLDSQAVKANKDAITLLGVFAMLPGGAAFGRLGDLCPSVPNWSAALRVLLGAALAQYSADKSFIQVLSPIRSYITLHHPLKGTALQDLRFSYYELAKKGALRPGDSDFLANVDELSTEEPNMDVILLDALHSKEGDKSRVIQASLDYSNYLYLTQPRTNIILAAVQVARISLKGRLADCLRSLGEGLYKQAKDNAAQTALQEARDEYISLGDRFGAANCLKLLGDVLWLQDQDDAAENALREAQQEYISLEEHMGVANCLRSLADLLYSQKRYDAAQTTSKEAHGEYVRLGNNLGAANCLSVLGNILGAQAEYDASYKTLMEAHAMYISTGDRLGIANCSAALGRTSRIQGRFADAMEQLREAQNLFTILGLPGWIQWCERESSLASAGNRSPVNHF